MPYELDRLLDYDNFNEHTSMQLLRVFDVSFRMLLNVLRSPHDFEKRQLQKMVALFI